MQSFSSFLFVTTTENDKDKKTKRKKNYFEKTIQKKEMDTTCTWTFRVFAWFMIFLTIINLLVSGTILGLMIYAQSKKPKLK